MNKTVAERAAELGVDQGDLVRALKALSRYRTKSVRRRHKHPYHRHSYTTKVPLFKLAQAAQMLGVSEKDAEKQIAASYRAPWNEKRVLDGLFAFIETHKRWPQSREVRGRNGLPSYWTLNRMVNAPDGWWNNDWVSPRDAWERKVAADKRCGPEMVTVFRNVLARKEAIDRIGFQKFINKGIATLIDDDPEFGQLYQLPGETPSEPMILLKVVNSTPDPDGTFSDYYLRVPPDMTSAREAVRWTFHGDDALGAQPYAPLIQT